MSSSREKEFGLLIAFILPGFITVLGLAHHSETLLDWIGQSSEQAPSVGGFLFLTVASVFAGMTVSTIRWAIIDTLHRWTGLRDPGWNFSHLAGREESFAVLIEIHYRYYQFYSNSIIAIICFVAARAVAVGFSWFEFMTGLLICLLFYAGSRDTLRKYYQRVDKLLPAGR